MHAHCFGLVVENMILDKVLRGILVKDPPIEDELAFGHSPPLGVCLYEASDRRNEPLVRAHCRVT